MATISYAFFASVTGPSYDLYPGDAQYWEMWGGSFDYGDAITVSAHPISGPGRALAVENIRVMNPGSSVLGFWVRNVGSRVITGYGLGFAWIDH